MGSTFFTSNEFIFLHTFEFAAPPLMSDYIFPVFITYFLDNYEIKNGEIWIELKNWWIFFKIIESFWLIIINNIIIQ